MTEEEFMLFDRIEKIKQIINKYGEENFYISFSGGKDSTVLHYLVDLALPGNKIPRVFINTGIEYIYIYKFVKSLSETDDRFVILPPQKSIKKVLEEYGYPFKSKEHSLKVGAYQKGSRSKSIMEYKDGYRGIEYSKYQCPKSLQYQYDDSFKLKISDQCCYKLKKEPIHKWEKEKNKTIAMTGMRKQEGGQRENIATCVVTRNSKVVKFHPLLVVSEGFEDWFIEKQNIQLCELYYPPYNFKRTGCKGCPFSLKLQDQLDTMQMLLPNEKKQCELIWKPVYDEYRRIGYRLRKSKGQLTIFDIDK